MSIDRALHLADQGYRVFPVKGKKPLVTGWPDLASNEPEKVRSMWAKDLDAGVGIATGGGLVVVDLDVKNGVDGVQAFTDWAEENGVEWSPTTSTRSGGQHVFFRASGDFGNRNGMLPGVDVKATRGYVVAYDDVPDLEDLPTLPEPVARIIGSKTESSSASSREITPAGVDFAVADELSKVEQETEGHRNDALNKAAYNLGQLVGDHLDEDEIRDRLIEAAGVAGLDRHEAHVTVESGLAAGMSNPRTVAEKPVIGDEDGSSWSPVPIDDVIAGLQDGTLSRPKPSIGRMDGGGALFYSGKVNGIAGPSGECKSWVAMLSACQEMEEGQNVVYIDFEDDVVGVVSRFLNDLHTAPETLSSRFIYVHPEERLGKAAETLTTMIRDRSPSLVVVDSTGESMAMEGAKPNDDDETARWFRQVPQRIASLGPAVLVVDHVVKSDDGGLWPIGSQRKRAAINGAQYIQRVVDPFSRGNPGHSKLVCAKDRHGNYAIGDLVGEFHLTGEEQFELIASTSHVTDEEAKHQRLMERIHKFIVENPGARVGEIRETMRPLKNGTTDTALRDLVKGKYVNVKKVGTSKEHTVTDLPFIPEFEGGDLL